MTFGKDATRCVARMRSVTVGAVAALTACCALLGCASSAWAGVGFGVQPDIPAPNRGVTVGETNVPSVLTIRNTSTDSQAPLTVRITSIFLVPSCGVATSGDCFAPDPNVFALSSFGVGRAGTACAGTTFTIVNVDQAQDKYQFVPNANVVLGPASTGGLAAQCIIDFTVDVINSPARDAFPQAGIQTNESSFAEGFASDGQPGSGSGSNRTTVARAAPSIATNASAGFTVGQPGTLSDVATVSGRVSPVAGATIDFRLYRPGDETCTGTAVFESLNVAYPVNGGPVTSAAYTPTQAGTYRWVASYSGDANNRPVAGACNDANETVTIDSPRTETPVSATTTTPPATTTPPPATATPPPATTPPPPPAVVAPARAVLPAAVVSPPRGTAAISGRTGCQGTPFRVSVSGSEIARVVFTMDGTVVRMLSKPNSGSRWVLPVNPRTKRPGIHRVLARVIFTTRSGTRSRTLRVTFSRCARRAATPAFTG